MSYDLRTLFNDYRIPYTTEGKNTQKGWINIQCPFCNDMSNHGGFNLAKQYYHCWRCGAHKFETVLKKLLHVSGYELQEILEHYSIDIPKPKEIALKTLSSTLQLPKTQPLTNQAKMYLINRNFNPEEIEKQWKIKSTLNIGFYKDRIFIPIYNNNQMVSFTTRDITNKHPIKYLSAKQELLSHKHIIYGMDYVKNKKAIVVEGCMDAWRIGPGAVALFGISYTKKQVLLLSTLSVLFILLDADAMHSAEKLYTELYNLVPHVEIITLPSYAKDPAELKLEDAVYIRKYLLNY